METNTRHITEEYMNNVMTIAKRGIRPDKFIIIWEDKEDVGYQFAHSYRTQADVDFIIATAHGWEAIAIISI
jgi:hypothetical protein